MDNNDFGSYLKQLRVAKDMTQEELAKAIGRGKMCISLFEKGKNAPPQGELLETMILALDLEEKDADHLRFLASAHRQSIPGDIVGYFFANPAIYNAIRKAQNSHIDNTAWQNLSWKLGGKDEENRA